MNQKFASSGLATVSNDSETKRYLPDILKIWKNSEIYMEALYMG